MGLNLRLTELIRVKIGVKFYPQNVRRRRLSDAAFLLYFPRLLAIMAAHWARVQNLLGPLP